LLVEGRRQDRYVLGRDRRVEGQFLLALGAVDEPLLAVRALVVGDFSDAIDLRRRRPRIRQLHHRDQQREQNELPHADHTGFRPPPGLVTRGNHGTISQGLSVRRARPPPIPPPLAGEGKGGGEATNENREIRGFPRRWRLGYLFVPEGHHRRRTGRLVRIQ